MKQKEEEEEEEKKTHKSEIFSALSIIFHAISDI